MSGQLEAEFEQVAAGRVIIDLRESVRNLKLGTIELTLHEEDGLVAVEIQAWHSDDEPVHGNMTIHGEKP